MDSYKSCGNGHNFGSDDFVVFPVDIGQQRLLNYELLFNLFQGLKQSSNLVNDLKSIYEEVRNASGNIDTVLERCNYNCVDFIFNLIGSCDKATEEIALSLVTKLIGNSILIGNYLQNNLKIFVYLLKNPDNLVCTCSLICRTIKMNRNIAKILAIDYNYIGLIIEEIPRFDGHENLFMLFSLMELIFKNLEHDHFYTEINGVPLIKIPISTLQQYIFSDDIILLESVLGIFDILLKYWIYGINNIFSEEVFKRILLLIKESNKIDIIGNNVLLDHLLNIINICLVTFIKAVSRKDLIEELINSLFYQLRKSPGSFQKILSFFSNIAYYKETSKYIFNSELIPFLMKQYNNMSYNIKESFLFIFCNASINNPNKILEIKDMNKVLIDCFDIANSLRSKKLCVLFMKAIYSIFSEDNDTVEIFDKSEIIEFLEDIKNSPDHDLFSCANILLEDFFIDYDERPDKLFI